MQLLSPATKRAGGGAGKLGAKGARVESRDDEVERCSAAVVASLPPVMWLLRREMGKHRVKGLSVSQYRVLCVVGKDPGATLSEVAENLGMGLPMVSRAVVTLSDRGFLKMVACEEDRRRKKLALTKSGQGIVDSSQDAIRAAVAERLEGLSAEQQRQIRSAIELLRRVCAPTRERASG